MAYIRPGTFFYPCVASALLLKASIVIPASAKRSPPRLITSNIDWINCVWRALILNSSLTPDWVLGNWSSSPAQEGLDGVTSEAAAGLCHCHTQAGSIHSSQVHSNKAAGKNSSRSVSFLRLYDACAHVACGVCSEPAEKGAKAKKKP